MFAMVFSHKEIAKPFLEAVLGIRIHELKDPEPEKTVEVSPVHKGVRFDVFVKEIGRDGETLRSFDIELQMEDTKEMPMSPETENIDRLVKWYQTDNETRIRYMTWQEEIDIAVDQERQRADDAENRLIEAMDRADEAEARANKAEAYADEAEARANKAEAYADAEKARADKYEKMLRDLGKL